MHILTVANLKGGVGKSMLACNVAVAAMAHGPTAVLDLDRFAYSLAWGENRGGEPPYVVQADARTLAMATRHLHRLGTELLVLDCPAYDEAMTLAAAQVADFVLIPVNAVGFAPSSVRKTLELVRQAERPHVLLINNATVRAASAQTTRYMLADHGTVSTLVLHNREAFKRAFAKGRAVNELRGDDGKAAAELRALWGYLARQLGITL